MDDPRRQGARQRQHQGLSTGRHKSCLVGLLVLLAMPAAGRAASEPPLAPAPVELRGWVTPFASLEFLESVWERAEYLDRWQKRFDTVYFDEDSGYMWTRKDNLRDIDWYGAVQYCKALDLGEFTDWILPTLEQLESLHERRSQGLYKLTSKIFISACCQWSSTTSGSNSALNFNFRYRSAFSGTLTHSYDLRAICLRVPKPEEIQPFVEEAEKQKRLAKGNR